MRHDEAYLEKLIQEECKPVGQHLLGDRLGPEMQGKEGDT